VHHATSVHGHGDAPDLREKIRSMLQDEQEDDVTQAA
jgi:hypothetical protein